MSILRRIFPLLLTAALLCACVQMPNTPQDVLPAPTPQSTAAPTATPETSPTPTPEPTVAPAMATATSNATKDAPQIKDPTTWDDNAAKTLAGLKTQFAAYGLTLDAKEGCPYLLAVNNAGGVVTVYAVDSATKKVRCTVHGDGVQRRHGHPHRVFFDPGGLQLAAADGPELRPVRDPHL